MSGQSFRLRRVRAVVTAGAVVLGVTACGGSKTTEVLGANEAREAEVDAEPRVSAALAAQSLSPSPEALAAQEIAAASSPLAAQPIPVGVNDLRVAVRGVERSYVAVVPPALPDGRPRSLMIVLHGVGGRGTSMRSYGFESQAAVTGTVLVYPDGVSGFWNDGRPGMDPTPAPSTADEVAFLATLIDEMTTRAGVAPRRVALAGFSNGAIMASRASCDLSERIAAFAAVGGTGGADYAQVCQPKQPLSVLVIAGINDPIVPFNGGQVADFQGRKRGRVASVSEFVNFWSSKCQCGGVKDTTTIKAAALNVTQSEAHTCGTKASVHFYRVQGGAHEWFRVNGFDSTKVVWDFVNSRAFV